MKTKSQFQHLSPMNRLFTLWLLILMPTLFFAKDRDSLSGRPAFTAPSLLLDDDCDACGCSVGSASSGFESILNPQFIGIKYLHQTYASKANVLDADYNIPEHYNTVQLWGRIPIASKIDLYASLPYHFHQRETTPQQTLSGIGDLSTSVIYKIALDSTQVHRLHIGAGVKIPIAKFDEASAQSYNPSFQRGTGSWDYSAILNYTFLREQWALAFSTDYTFKTQNKKYYRFGDQWNTSLTGYYIHNFQNFTLSPRLGIATEKYLPNVQVGEEIPHTGGYIVLSKIGAEVAFKRFNIGIESQLPLKSALSDGYVRIRNRHSLYVNFNL